MFNKLLLLSTASLGIFTSCAQENPDARRIPPQMYLVEPVQASGQPAQHAPDRTGAAELQLGQTNFFTFALPQGWRLGENGQYALILMAADSKALTVMVGNSGFPEGYNPSQFVYEKLSSLRPENLQISEPIADQPIAGFQQAYTYQVQYSIGGVPCRGVATCHIAPYYGGSTMALTAALSESSQWPSYASWLPLVSRQVSASNGAAFGMRGVMQQNLQQSTAFAEAAREYRSWSQRNWQATTDHRNASIDRQNEAFRENLGAVRTYTNPYDNGRQLELTTQYEYYWVDRQGQILGTNEAGANPNHGSTGEWQQMDVVKR